MRFLSLLLFMQIVDAQNQCSTSCGLPSGLSFCRHISYAVCKGDQGFLAQDLEARRAVGNWTNEPMATYLLTSLPQYRHASKSRQKSIIAAMNLTDTHGACSNVLRRLYCSIHLPVCEVAKDVSRLCLESCEEAVDEECPGLANVCSLVQEETGELAEMDLKCVPFDYNGPAVGMWVAGFLISLVFSVLNSVGINLQKLSMRRNASARTKKHTCKQPLWVLGFVLVCLGSILDFVAFGMAPQTLLAPLAALSLVWNMLIAPSFHKERVTRHNLLATCIIFTGVTLTVIFAGHSTPSYELQDLIKLYQQPVMYIYIACVVSFLVILYLLCIYIERSGKRENGLMHIVCYGGIAGTFGGQSVLFAKSAVELIKSAVWGDAGNEMFRHYAYYLINGSLVICLLCQIRFLNGGLARFDALLLVPVYQSFWILMSVLGGIMYFEEYAHMTSFQILMFTIGGVITITGIIVLLVTRKKGVDMQDSVASRKGSQYVEVQGLTPSDAWDVDDSEDEEMEVFLAKNTKPSSSEASSKATVARSPERLINQSGSIRDSHAASTNVDLNSSETSGEEEFV